MDPRITQLAENLVNHSCKVKAGEKVLIESVGTEAGDLVKALIRKVYEAGGLPFVRQEDPELERELILHGTTEQWLMREQWEAGQMRQMDAFIGIRGPKNPAELSDLPGDKMGLYQRHYKRKITDLRVNHTRWVVLRYPNAAMAQKAGMSLEGFQDFYFDVCNLDYSRMGKAMEALKARMDRTNHVRILGPGTDLTFSLEGMSSIICAGECNIPDGEVYTAPVKESVEGTITYSAPSMQRGILFQDICLRFEKGRIVEATSSDTRRINEIFDMDEGARYVGEFALGIHPYITKPMQDILFDEKIAGSFHFTPGNAYEDADNGNRSALHWDLVSIQTHEWGGGEIWFDQELIRKDGIFVVEDLLCCNPEALR